MDPVCCPQRRPFYPEPILSSRALEKTLFRSDVEAVLYQHFFYALYPHLILSSAHPGFHTGYVLEFVDKVFFFDGLRHVVFACAASHMYLVSEKTQLHELSLTYYSRAVSDVNRALDGIDSIGDKSCDALLTAIIFLYIHGVSLPGRSKCILSIPFRLTDFPHSSGDQPPSVTPHNTSTGPSNY